MNLLKVLIFSLLATSAYAVSPVDVCQSMSFNSGKTECFRKINNENFYYQSEALSICLGMSFDNGKLKCLDNIADKEYQNYEIRHCNDESFDSGKNECLTNMGRSYRRPNPPRCDDRQINRRVRRKLQRAIRLIEANNPYGAIELLERILERH